MDPSGDADWAWRSPAYAWFVVVILALGVTLSFVLAAMLPMTIGPLLRDPAAVVAFVSDSLLHDEAKVHLSLAIVSGVFLPLSAAILGLGLRARQAIDRGALAALA